MMVLLTTSQVFKMEPMFENLLVKEMNIPTESTVGLFGGGNSKGPRASFPSCQTRLEYT